MLKTQVALDLAHNVTRRLGLIAPTIIGDCFIEVENDVALLSSYQYGASLLGAHVFNCWFAKYISRLTGRVASGRKFTSTSTLIKSGRFSELILDGSRHV